MAGMIDQPAILIPVYNGADELPALIEGIPSSFLRNVVFIDDGSTDQTSVILKDADLMTIRNSKNRGKGYSLKIGIQNAERRGYTSVIHLDSDLQHPPEFISGFAPKSGEMRYGYRKSKHGMPLHRRFSNFFTSLLITIRSGVLVRDSQCGFRGFSLDDYRQIVVKEDRFHFESELMLKFALLGVKLVPVVIPTIYEGKKSAIHPYRDTYQFIKLWFRSYFWT